MVSEVALITNAPLDRDGVRILPRVPKITGGITWKSPASWYAGRCPLLYQPIQLPCMLPMKAPARSSSSQMRFWSSSGMVAQFGNRMPEACSCPMKSIATRNRSMVGPYS